MAQELVELPPGDNGCRSLMAARCIQHEVLEQERNVLLALAQRRQIDDRHVQTIEQVLSELSLFHEFDQVRLAGGDDAEVDRYRIVGAQPFNLLLLQDPQELDLHRRRHAFDFVEKEGATMRVLDFANSAARRLREGARLVAEHLALEELVRQSTAIDPDEWFQAAAAMLMQAAADQLLARPRLSLNQDIRRRAGQLQDKFSHALNSRRMSQNDGFDALLVRKLTPQGPDLQDQAAIFRRSHRH